MSKTVNIQDVQQNLAELLTLAQAGAEIVIVENDRPLAKLIPFMPKARVAGLNRGAMVVTADDFDAPLPDEFWAGVQ